MKQYIYRLHQERGFTLITGVLLISAVVLLGLLTLATTTLTTNDSQIVGQHYYQVSTAADSCLEEALLRLKRDPTITSSSLSLQDNSCTIQVVTLSATQYRITIDATRTTTETIRLEVVATREPRGQGSHMVITSYTLL